mmetsp:Transcript_5263/g.11420  ORF Transcript_5263/g.11420 Transcript_5263/m.11420 type:complete len:346 (+) Transcript_5263:82-1119(+)
MNQSPAGQWNRRPSGRARRPAMIAGTMLAKMPRHLRKVHLDIKDCTTTKPSTLKVDTRKDQRVRLLKEEPTSHHRGHVRQQAMVWDDLVSIVRVEMMRMEKKLDFESANKNKTSSLPRHFDRQEHYDGQSNITTSFNHHIHSHYNISTQLSNFNITSEVQAMKSPPRITRMTFCFDSNSGCGGLPGPSERLLLSSCLTGRRMPISFHEHGNENDCGPTIRRGDASMYFSDEDNDDSFEEHVNGDDEGETSSLEYSDDNSDVELAIIASSAIRRSIPSSSRRKTGDSFQCTICLEDTGRSDLATVSGCEHRFCFTCIDRWAEMKSECPLCKKGFHWVACEKRVRWY